MSEITEAYENFEKISKDRNFIFRIDEERNTYELEFIEKPNFSREGYIETAKYIKEDWPFSCAVGIADSDVPQKFLTDDRGLILTIGLSDTKAKDKISITRLLIPRNYEKSKKLVDYVLKIISSKKPDSI
jgi:hypothetical protein